MKCGRVLGKKELEQVKGGSTVEILRILSGMDKAPDAQSDYESPRIVEMAEKTIRGWDSVVRKFRETGKK